MTRGFRISVWIIAIFPLMGFWLTGLFDLDEGFYSAIVGEMIRRGEWITPYYNGEPWFEKPILLYWISKPFVMLFGEVWGPRIPGVLCTLALAGAIWSFGRRMFNESAAIWAMLIWSTSLLAVGVGRMMMTDMPLVLCFTLAMLTFYRSLTDGWRWRVLSAGFLGLSVLAKGPVSCAHFILIVAIFAGMEPTLRSKFRGGWLLGTALFLAVVASWYLPCYLANRDLFVQEFLIKQNIGRFAGGDKAHGVPLALTFIYYIPILLVGMAPWSFSLFRAWPRRGQAEPAVRYVAIWFAVVFLFYTVSGSKLPHYILAALPAAALLIGDWIGRRKPGAEATLSLRSLRFPAGVALIVGLVANLGIGWWYQDTHAQLHSVTRWVRAQGGPVVEYQFSRRSEDRGTGQLKLMETSHPSLKFYLDRVVPELETLDELARLRESTWVLTRGDRISAEDLRRAPELGIRLEPVATPSSPAPQPSQPTGDYVVWRVTPVAGR